MKLTKKLPQEKIDKIIQLRQRYLKTYDDISKELGLSKSVIAKYLKKYNLQDKSINQGITEFPFCTPKQAVAKQLPDVIVSNRIDNVYADNIFEKIDTEEKAYWLGFLYADGCVSANSNTISLSLKESDVDHLKRFRTFLHLDGKLLHKRTKYINGNAYVGYRFYYCSKKAKTDLISNGCIPKKTFTLKFPSDTIISPNLLNHFIRGYYGGDGSCTHGGNGSSKISLEILGTQNFLNGYIKWTTCESKLFGFNHSSINRSILSGPYAIFVLDKLYDNASIYLERKYNIYLNLRRLALKSPRTARLLAGKIGEGRAISSANPEVTL